MGLPSQGRSPGDGMRVSSRSKRKLGLPGPAIPLIVVGVAIIAVWGGYRLLGPSDAGASQGGSSGEGGGTAETATGDSDLSPISAPEESPTRGLLGDAADRQGLRSRGAPPPTMSSGLSALDEAEPEAPAPNAGVLNQEASGLTVVEEEASVPTIIDPLHEPLGDAGGAIAMAEDVGPALPESVAARPRVSAVAGALERARELESQNELVGARDLLSRALADAEVARDRETLRAELTRLNETLVFGPRVFPDDPMSEEYVIESGDSLARITRKRELGVHWKMVQRVNRISRPERIRVGQKLKLVRGPFNAIVHKNDFRIDIYHGPPTEPSRWIYVTSRPVGLGEFGSTPEGVFVVRQGSKLENPAWVNPRDGRESYSRDDPENPIGEYWVGLEGLGDAAVHDGYGLHGTIEPESIGRQMSMGCVRMHDEDIALVYELLEEGISVVRIVP